MSEDNFSEQDKKDIERMYPAWRRTLLSLHTQYWRMRHFLSTPFRVLVEHLDGTAALREELRKMEQAEATKNS